MTDDLPEKILLQWKEIYKKHRPLLKGHKKSADEVLQYLLANYPLLPETSPKAVQTARLLFLETGKLFPKTTGGLLPEQMEIAVYRIENTGAGERLYRSQKEDYRQTVAGWRELHPDAEDLPDEIFPFSILIFIEKTGGTVHTEGSPALQDEIELFQGHSDEELDNVYITARYVSLLEQQQKTKN